MKKFIFLFVKINSTIRSILFTVFRILTLWGRELPNNCPFLIRIWEMNTFWSTILLGKRTKMFTLLWKHGIKLLVTCSILICCSMKTKFLKYYSTYVMDWKKPIRIKYIISTSVKRISFKARMETSNFMIIKFNPKAMSKFSKKPNNLAKEILVLNETNSFIFTPLRMEKFSKSMTYILLAWSSLSWWESIPVSNN